MVDETKKLRSATRWSVAERSDTSQKVVDVI